MNQNTKKRKLSKTAYHLKNLGLLLVSIFFIYTFTTELSTTFALNKDIAEAEKVRDQLAQERATLEKQQEMLKDPNYVINYARGKLLISQDGEQIFYLEENK